MPYRKWEVASADKEIAKQLADECDVDPFVALIAVSRGYTDPVQLDEFLSDEALFVSPDELSGMSDAVGRITLAHENDELIAVYGDYDCDGVTATALLYSYLQSHGFRAVYYIPDRLNEGYGMNCTAIDRLYEKGVSLIVTVDNGISSREEIAYAAEKGIGVVVTDHHLPPEKLPLCAAIVDPHLSTCYCDFKDFCGVSVAYKLVCALEGKECEELFDLYGDLVAIGTVGDVMPLVAENRAAVKAGISLLKLNQRMGLATLLQEAAIDCNTLDAGRIAFGIVPRLNAAGRVGDAARAVRLLLTVDKNEAAELATEICANNTDRQTMEKDILRQAVEQIETCGFAHDRIIVASGEGWHHGVVGIVASRICEKYGRPAIVLSNEDGIAAGSGRSIGDFSLYNAISAVSGLLMKFGGHELAAGLTLQEDKIDDFRKAINIYAATVSAAIPILSLDCKLNPAALSLDLVDSLSVLEPFGAGNPKPLFGLYDVTVDTLTPVSNNKHLRIGFVRGDVRFQAMLFSVGTTSFGFAVGDTVDLAVTLDNSHYGGKNYLSVQIKEMRIHGLDEEKLFSGLALYDSFCRGESGVFENLVPSRGELGTVYKAVHTKAMTLPALEQHFSEELGVAKVRLSVDIFKELGLFLCTEQNGVPVLAVCTAAGKVNLDDSLILKRLRG